jgi:hypothetical protein
LDRDGEHFAHILHYLRNGVLLVAERVVVACAEARVRFLLHRVGSLVRGGSRGH